MKIRVPIEPEEPAKDPYAYEATVAGINRTWGEISKFGTKTMPDGRAWVIHGLTGEALERIKAVPVSQDGNGNVIYLRPGEKVKPLDKIYPSVWVR